LTARNTLKGENRGKISIFKDFENNLMNVGIEEKEEEPPIRESVSFGPHSGRLLQLRMKRTILPFHIRDQKVN